MNKIEFIRDNTKAFQSNTAYGYCNSTRKLVPVYFERNGKRFFVINYDVTTSYSEDESKEEANGYRTQLEANNGRYFAFYGDPDVWAFLKYVKTNGYNFEHFTKFSDSKDFCEFHGNLQEVSYAFHYRIYDRRLFARLRKHLPDIKISHLN